MKHGAIPMLFTWNNYSSQVRRLWERRAKPENVQTGEDAGRYVPTTTTTALPQILHLLTWY